MTPIGLFDIGENVRQSYCKAVTGYLYNMKNFLLTLIFTLSSAHMYSQEVNFGLSLGTGLSNQTLQSSNSPYTLLPLFL